MPRRLKTPLDCRGRDGVFLCTYNKPTVECRPKTANLHRRVTICMSEGPAKWVDVQIWLDLRPPRQISGSRRLAVDSFLRSTEVWCRDLRRFFLQGFDPLSDSSTHFDSSGNARMVDVSAKLPSVRTAEARGRIAMNEAAAKAARSGESKKGDVLAVARLAAIQATKLTDRLIPLCHNIPIEAVEVDFEWGDEAGTNAGVTELDCRVLVQTTAKTGVEMEAMTGVSVACLTVYDMLKSVDRAMKVEEIRLIRKTGGKSGDYLHSP